MDLVLRTMEEQDISQREIARRAKVSSATVNFFCGKRAEPKWSTVVKILEAIGYDVWIGPRARVAADDPGDVPAS